MASAQPQTCLICLDDVKQPKVLDCQHIFCLKCLQELKRQDPETLGLPCPVCRSVTNFAGRSVADLRDGSLSTWSIWGQLSKGQRSHSTCQACDKKNPAVSKCLDCDHLLCKECQWAHGQLTVMKSHRIHMLDQSLLWGMQPGQSSKKIVIPKCGSHASKKIIAYCNTCEQSVCKQCSVFGQAHYRHTIVSLEEVLDNCKQQDKELKAVADKTRAEFNMTILEADKSIKELNSKFQATNKKISQKADGEAAKIRAEEEKLKHELKMIFQDQVKIFDSARAANSTEVALVEQEQHSLSLQTAQASCFEAPHLKKSFLKSIQGLKQKQPLKVDNSLAFMDFTEGEELLGRLVLDDEQQTGLLSKAMKSLLAPHKEEKWQLCKTEIKEGIETQNWDVVSYTCKTKIGFAFSVAAFSDNVLAIADTGSEVLITSSPKGYHPLAFTSTNHGMYGIFTEARYVSVDKDEQLVILNKTNIKILSREHKCLNNFTVESKCHSATCLATEDNGLIAVGYEKNEEVTLYWPDGSIFRRVPTPMIGSYLAIYQQQLIYTNWDRKKLLAVNYNGAKIFSADIKSPEVWWGPTGLCCNSRGCIYVAVCGQWPFPGQIQQYSPSGEYLGWIVERCSTVYGMTLMKDETTLVVAAREAVKFYQRVPTTAKGKKLAAIQKL